MSLIQCILISIINCFAGSGTSPWGGVLAKVQDNATELETDADVLSALYDEVKIR